jgi:hypothetical protein
MSTFRTLPPRPSLEYEHKAAKALLRQLRADDIESLSRARARHPAITDSPQLADAQLVIAREYGFTSWPRLVRYFEDLERQRESPYLIKSRHREDCDPQVRSMISGHRGRCTWAGRALAAFVPRFYGMRHGDIFESTLTEDEARLAAARMAGFSSWEDMLARTVVGVEKAIQVPEDSPFRATARAMEALDLEALQRVAAAHPEVLRPAEPDAVRGGNLLNFALGWEKKHGREAMRPIMEWLAGQGLDLQRELNVQLCGRIKMPTERVRELLDRGADPDWVAPNGVPVLEHALIRYWNAEAVDLIAERVQPRRALWIAAGLGDVEGVGRFLDRDGRPTAEVRQHRPPFDLVGPMLMSHPDPNDEELLVEAFFVAMVNTRIPVLEYMVSRGTPINSMIYGSPLINVAVGNTWLPVIECLVRCGADLDLRGFHPDQTARELARGWFEEMPENADRRRTVELLGMDPEAILAERAKRSNVEE